MVAGENSYVKRCGDCGRPKSSNKYQRWLQLFVPSGPFRFDVRYSPDPLTETMQKNRFVIVTTSCYSKFKRAVLVPEFAAWLVAKVFLELWVGRYGIQNMILVDSTAVCVRVLCSIMHFNGHKAVHYYKLSFPSQSASRMAQQDSNVEVLSLR